MDSEQDGHGSNRPVGNGADEVAGPEPEDAALLRALDQALRELVPPSPVTGVADPDAFDPDAAAVEIVTRGLDPELRAAVDADPHGTVLPPDGMTFGEMDELLASLVALAVHTATAAADRCESTAEEIVAAAALRLRSA